MIHMVIMIRSRLSSGDMTQDGGISLEYTVACRDPSKGTPLFWIQSPISTSEDPMSTLSPSEKWTLVISPGLGARILCSIFIASKVIRCCPSRTLCPSFAMTWRTVPGIGALRLPSLADDLLPCSWKRTSWALPSMWIHHVSPVLVT